MSTPATSLCAVAPHGQAVAAVTDPGEDSVPTVLLAAFAAVPGYGSESALGYYWIRLYLRSGWRVVLLTHEEPLEDLATVRRDFAAHLAAGRLELHVLRQRFATRWLRRVPGLFFIAYRWYQIRLLRLARRVLRRHPRARFVHQVTLCSFREPGELHRLPLPFVWGPIGGVQDAAGRLLVAQPRVVALLERLRTAINRYATRLARRPRVAARRAALVLAANPEAFAWARRWARCLVIEELETAANELVPPCRPDLVGRSGILFVGNDEPRKNHEFAILAFALLRSLRPHSRLTLVGLSPRRERQLRRWSDRRGLALTGVTFVRKLPPTELARLYRTHRLLWFPSYRDTSGNVVLESMRSGCPAVGFRHQGAAVMMRGGAGVLVPLVGGYQRLLRAWVRASLPLLDDDVVWRSIAETAYEQGRTLHDWEAKRRRLMPLLDHIAAVREPARATPRGACGGLMPGLELAHDART